MIADTGGLYALYDGDDRWHRKVVDFIESVDEPVIVPVVILAELSYMLNRKLGIDAELELLRSVAAGEMIVEPLTPADISGCARLIEQYRGLNLGLADASVFIVADRLRTNRILTVDERHFRAVTSTRGQAFTLLPADSDSKSMPR